MTPKTFTHNGVELEWRGKLIVARVGSETPLTLTMNSNSAAWRLTKKRWLTLKQFNEIIKNKFSNE